jgi:serine/threonine protein kinase
MDVPFRIEQPNNPRRRRRLQLFQPTPGARLTFTEMNASTPRDRVQETFAPEIHPAVTNPSNTQVLPSVDVTADELLPIYLLRETGADKAYALVGKEPIKLNHHYANWGEVHFAVVYYREGGATSNSYRAPTRDTAEMVAIKKLNKAAVNAYLARGGEENPYKELCRMQELGDDVHVLGCRDALQDEDYLYIVTPKACDEGTLVDVIQWQSTDSMDSNRSKTIYIKLLRILAYLEEHGISHRDFTPDNFIFLTPDNLVVFDLALSHRVPTDEKGQRVLTNPQGNFGTHAYMAPEIFQDRVFCGIFSDLWSATVILYNLLTNRILYYLPVPADISFRYNILARGLSSIPINERTVEILQDADEGEHHLLFQRAMAHLNLSSEATELLNHLLESNPPPTRLDSSASHGVRLRVGQCSLMNCINKNSKIAPQNYIMNILWKQPRIISKDQAVYQ